MAAVELLDQQDYASTTLEQIAQRVGMTPAAVYRHFRNKQAILDAAAAWATDVVMGRIGDGHRPDGALPTVEELVDDVVQALQEAGELVSILSRHLHPAPVFGMVLKGKWHYFEHDWVAEEGSFVYEPPGEIHTLNVPEDCDEMITFFNISGCMVYLNEENKQIGYEDVFTKIDMCRAHYEKVGLGADYVDQFIR